MELRYWIRRGGKVRGPYSADKLVAASKAGKTHDGDAVATSESGPWHDLGRWLQKRDRPLTVAKVRYHKKPFGLSLLGVGATVSYQCPKCAADLLSDAASIGSGETCEKCRVHFTFSSEAQRTVEEEIQKAEQLADARELEKRARSLEKIARQKEREEQRIIQQAAAVRAANEKKDRDARAAAEAKRQRDAAKADQPDFTINMLLGLAGAGAMLLGFLCPIIRLPIIGGMSYLGFVGVLFRGGGVTLITISAFLVIASAVVAFLAAVAKSRYLFWVSGSKGVLAVVLTMAKVFSFQFERAGDELAGNPFAGLATAMVEAVPLDFGLAVIVAAVAMIIAAAAVSTHA